MGSLISKQRFKFLQEGHHPVLLNRDVLYNQQLNNLHWHPATAGMPGNRN
jgi:hypothetical protein